MIEFQENQIYKESIMAIVKPFRAFRPVPELAHLIASRPYDVLNSTEARIEASNNEHSFLHVTKSEIDLPENIDTHSVVVYEKAKENLQKMIENGILVQDSKPSYYIYAQAMNNRMQYGFVGCAAVSDFNYKIIKEHELTRPDKEKDRMDHIRATNFNAEPVFFAYHDNEKLQKIIDLYSSQTPVYDFTASDSIIHKLWVIEDQALVKEIEKIFKEEVRHTYVADGHHRTAAAAKVGAERVRSATKYTGHEEFNYFMAVHFPASHLAIFDYNRVVKDLNGRTAEQFLDEISKSFDIQLKGTEICKPDALHNFTMYLGGNWYSLTAKSNTYNDNDPIGVLDVTILTNEILVPVLDIVDLRTSTRIDFVGGIRGLAELQKKVDSGEMAAAFALYPVSMKQLMDIADSGKIMPPKTTWFEPKLRSGLTIHDLE